MKSPSNGFKKETDQLVSSESTPVETISSQPKKGPLSFLSVLLPVYLLVC